MKIVRWVRERWTSGLSPIPPSFLGKPLIRGTRVPVYLIVGRVEAGQAPEQIVDDYPDLTIEDVGAAVAYAVRESSRNEVRALQGGLSLFLLDANLSPKVGRFLTREFNLDVFSLQGQRLGALPDHEVIRMARSMGRVVITLDGDSAEYFHRAQRPNIGIIYLDLTNALRTIPEINRLLAAFFREHVEGVALEHALVIITEHEVRIIHG